MSTPAQQLGPYRLIECIGRGGMGEVWKARDTRLDREVAVKLSAEQFSDRFEREARAIAALNHPNICTLFDVGPNYLVMELIEGPTLADRIAEGPIPLEESLAIARQIADALEAAHEKNIVHRDLKPANIKLRPDGSVKVLDFGLAKSSGPETVVTGDSPTMLHTPTQIGVILGTAAYMAPEQARGKSIDKRADIWAFGVVLHEMVTGKRLFEGEDLTETLAAVVKSDPDLAPAPHKVRRLIAKCLQKDPKKRLRDIGDAWELLEDARPVAVDAQRSWVWPAVAGVFALALAALAFIHFREKPAELLIVRTSILPPPKTAFQTISSDSAPPELSPDGRLLVFGARSEDGSTQLYVRALGSMAAQPLAGTEGAIFPFWSPDSKSIGFGADGKLKKIDAAGGPAVTLADAVALRGGTWSKDGIIVFAPSPIAALRKVAATGGIATPATDQKDTPGFTLHRWPWFLPDGRHFLYIATLSGYEDGEVRIGSLDSRERSDAIGRPLGKVNSQAVYSQGYLLFLRGQSLMAQPFDDKRLTTSGEAVPIVSESVVPLATLSAPFTVSAGGVLAYQSGEGASPSLAWFDRSGKRSATGFSSQADAGSLFRTNASPDGRLAAVSVTVANNMDIWIYDLARSLRTRFTFDPAAEQDAVWSPDGKTIVFNSNRKGHYDLYRKAVNGSSVEELLYADGAEKFPTSWSADGRYLLYFAQDPKSGRDIYALPLAGEIKPFPFVKTDFNEFNAQFSPDGHWVAYQSDESGRFEIYLTPFPGPGGKRQISTAGGVQPRWRRDGKELFYLVPGGELMAAEVTLDANDAQVGAVRPLFTGLLTGAGYQYDVSPDGQRFLATVPSEQAGASEPLTLVQDWTAGLKK